MPPVNSNGSPLKASVACERNVHLKNLLLVVELAMLIGASSCVRAALDPSNECYKSLAGKSELAPLSDKVGLSSVPDQTFAMLANKEIAKPSERPVIARWAELMTECYKIGRGFRESLPLSVQQSLEDQKANLEDLAVQLYDGRISYGEFATKRRSLAAVTLSKLAALQQAAKADAALESSARERESVAAKIQAREQVQREAQTAALAAAQRCQSARANMVEVCKAPTTQSNGQANPFAITPVDPMSILECQKWKNEVNELCR